MRLIAQRVNLPGRLGFLGILGLLGLLVPITSTLVAPSAAEARVLERFGSLHDVDLEGARSVTVSPDGRYVYLGGGRETVLFERNASTGKLTYVGTVDRSESLDITSDGRWSYGAWSGVRVHSRDVETGRLSLVEEWDYPAFEEGAPSSLWLGPDSKQIYGATDGSLVVFDRDPTRGTLDVTQTLVNGVDGVEGIVGDKDLAFSPDGRFLYMVATDFYEGASLSIFGREEDGTLSLLRVITSDDAGFESLAGPHTVRVSLEGRSVYVAGSEGLLVLDRSPFDGLVDPVETVGTDSRALATSRDDRFVYLFRSEFVEVYERQAGGGPLSLLQTFEMDVQDLAFVWGAEFSPDGRQIYVSTVNSGSVRGGIAVLSRDPSTGTLGLIEAHLRDVDNDAAGIEDAVSMAVSPDGRHVYTGADNSYDLELGAYSRSSDTGELELIAEYGDWLTEGNSSSVEAIATSPDGLNLYLIYQDQISDWHLVALSRNPESGELDFLQAFTDGVDDIDGLYYADALVVSPDGRHVYVAGSGDDAVPVFERDASTGELTLLRIYYDGQDGFEGLAGASDLVFTSSGEFLYVAATRESALTALRRDPATGELTEIESQGNRFYAGMALSPDERYLYAGRYGITVFARDLTTGRLVEVESHEDDQGDPIVTADGQYVVAFKRQASAYRRDPASGRLTLVERDDFPNGFRAQTAAQSPDGENFYAAGVHIRFDRLFQFRRNEGPCREVWDGLCLGDDRFLVDLTWRDFEGNTGTAKPAPSKSDDSAILWFFGPDNWEMQLKVLDACGLNDRFWVFAAATTNVEYTLRVTDVVTGTTRTYVNPLGHAASAITDTDAFSCSGAAAADGAQGLAVGSPVVRTAYQQAPPSLDKVLDGPGLLTGLGGKCLDVENGDRTDGSPVVLYDCHGQENQRWNYRQQCSYHCSPGFEFRIFEDKCLIPGPDAAEGFRQLVIGPCDQSESLWSQSGTFPRDFSLIHQNTGLCVDVLGASTDNRTPVGLFGCHDGENQMWDFDSYACRESPIETCKALGRFTVEVDWRDFDGNTGKGRVVPQESGESGLFWFFGPDNYEMLVKVLDGCDLNDQFWVFSAATTNVEYTLRVTDSRTGEVREYFNPLGNAAPAITDTSAFSCSP